MKRLVVVMVLLVALPAAAWAQELSNAELYQMIKKMERKFDQAIDQTNRALAEAQQAKEEAALAKEEAARAKEEIALAKEETARVRDELAQLKAAPVPVATLAEVPAASVVQVPETTEGLGTSFEVLYMRPSRSNLDYVIVDTDSDSSPEGRFAKVEPNYDNGGRFGLSYNLGSGTALFGQYTMLNTKDSDSVTEPTGGSLWATWTHPDSAIDSGNATAAKMTYEFDHNVFDLGVRKWIEVGNDLGLQIDTGLRYANMNQDIDINYQTGLVVFSDVHNENDFTGWGPRLGLGLDWSVGKGFNVFGSAAGSVLVGDFDMSLTQVDNGTTAIYNVKDSEDNRVVPVLEMRAGVEYAYQLENGMFVGAKIGYEWQNWFNIVVAKRFMDDVDEQLLYTDTTDVSLDGFFVEGFVNF